MTDSPKKYPLWQIVGAWATHAFTASGIVCSLFAIDHIAHHNFAYAFYFLMAALIIDGVDGTFARLFKVWDVLPGINGKTMDYIIDFANYALIPGYFIYESGLLPEEWRWLAVSILLVVSAIYYAKEGMVDDSMHFVGFPVMWNVVAFYLFFVFEAGPWVSFWWIIIFAIAHFIPLKYPYPSRTRKFMWLNIAVSAITSIVNITLIIFIGEGIFVPYWLKVASVVGGCYYVLIAFWYTWDENRSPKTSPS